MPSEQPKNDNKACEHHTPDWSSIEIHIEQDGVYFDVTCVDCGCSGCMHRFDFKDEIQW